MSALSVTCMRTVSRARWMFSTALAAGGFLAAAGVTFAFSLEAAEGAGLSLVSLWSMSVAPWLPVLAAFLAMDVWSDERQTGRIDMLLSAPVRDRDYVLGKFLGVWTMSLCATVFFLLSSATLLWFYARPALSSVEAVDFLPALAILALQSALWSSASVAVSVFFCHGAAAAFTSVMLTSVLPRGAWKGLLAWSKDGRIAFGEMPFDAHVFDCASGVVSVSTCAAYVVVTAVLLFVATVSVGRLRLVGRGARGKRLLSWTAISLAVVFGALSVNLARRLDWTVEISPSGLATAFSPRTRAILAESSGTIKATCFLPRNDARFRFAAHLLTSLKRASSAVGGARFEISYVDPHWDVGAAERLVRRGVATDSLVFETSRRMVAIPISDGLGERVCASTVRRLTSPPPRHTIFWTVGHGETGFASYDTFGMSDVARDLMREGFSHKSIDLAKTQQVPDDCALILIAGAADDFARAELDVLDAYLRAGGRLLVLMSSAHVDGLATLLSTWGLRPQERPVAAAKTISGTDVIVSGFADHPVSSSLKGLRIVLERPVAFAPSMAAASGAGADAIGYSAIAHVDNMAIAAAVERGEGAGKDIAVRPTRIIAVGDAGFVLNGQLAARANANCDFFLNCIAYLAGTDPPASGGAEVGVLSTGMDRSGRFQHTMVSAVALPAFVFVVLLSAALRRRYRR